MATTIHTVYNMVKVNVSGTYDDAQTSIDLDTGEQAKCPTPPYWMMWWDATNYANPFDDPKWEIVEVTAHNASDNITVVRGQQTTLGGKAASTKNTAGASYKMSNEFTAYDLERLRERCAFFAHRDGVDQTAVVHSTYTKVQLNTEDFDLTGDFDTTNNRFVAPRAMVMHFTGSIRMLLLAANTYTYVRLYSSVVGELALGMKHAPDSAISLFVNVSKTIKLAVSEQIELQAYHSDSSSTRDIDGPKAYTYLTGFEVLPQ